MAFIVEDGTGLDTATSYVSVDDFKSYWTDRAVDYSAKTDAEIQASLIKATQYIDNNFRFIGYKASYSQALEFPRYLAYTREGYLIDGIPNKLVYAVNEATAIDLAGTSLFSSTEQGISEKTENVGPVKTNYKYSGTATGRTTYQTVSIYLKDLVKSKRAIVKRY